MQNELRGWLPFQIQKGPESVDCRWLYLGAKRFTEPFFEETTSSCLSLPENSFAPPRITRLDQLPEIASGLDAIEPSAFIFHVSRCGSTLVSQLLGLDETCVTLSEVPFFDRLLRARFQPGLTGAVDAAKLLPSAMRIHAQRRFGNERSLVVKLDSWHTGFHAEVRALYPRTPFILLYRDPISVIRSHRKQPGMHSVRGVIEDEVFHFAPAESPSAPSAHLPRVLAFYYETFLGIARSDPHSLLVPYQPDMVSAAESVASFAGIELSPEHSEKMRERAAFHAKRPREDFRESPIEGEVNDASQECLARYEELEGLRESRV